MKHKLLQSLMLIAVLLTSTHALAHDFEAKNSDGVTIYYKITSSADKACEVTYKGSYSYQFSDEYTGSIVIPETVTYNGTTYSVTSIGNEAFYKCSGLTSVTIGNSVTNIGDNAFYGCSGLTSITIPNSVTSIGAYAFSYCTGLTSVTIPNSVTSIDYNAFGDCTGLTTIKVETGNSKYDSRNNCNAIIETESNTLIIGCKNTIIPNSVTSIGSDAFYGCAGLTSVTIPNSVTSIGRDAFYGCTGLTSITIPNSVTSIGYEAFYGCSGLSSITIPNSVTSIGSYAFYGCSGLTTIKVETGNSKYDSRNNCNAIIETSTNKLITGCKNTTIPNSVISIGFGAFCGCSGLTSITIPNSVTSIGAYAFSYCTGLTSITIPNSVTSIGNCAFYNCIALKELRIEDGETTLSLGYNSYRSSGIGEGLFYDCPLETLYLGRNIKYTDYNTSNTYSEYPERYGYSAFYNIKKLKTVTIGNSVASIGSYAFYGCRGLTSVTIPNSVTSIGESAFKGCSALTSVTIPNSVTSIGNYAFDGCSGLTSITIPNSVTSIGRSAFTSCTGLSSVIFNAENCEIMGTSDSPVFKDCNKLSSVTIGENVKSIPDYAFSGCYGLTSVIFNAENCKTMGSSNYPVFNNCTKLSSVTIGENVKNIPHYAFRGCSGLTSITIPNSITSIGSEAFENCSGLTSVNISDLEAWCKIDFGDYDANPLYYAKKLYLNGELLTGLIIPDSIKKIKNYAFRGCTSLTSISIPNSVTSIGDNAFAGCSGLTGVTIPDGVTSIGVAAFYGCSGLSSITIPNSVTSIGSDALFGCTGLCSIKRNATATTQTKLNFDITNNTEYESFININNKTYTTKDTELVISELSPETWYSYYSGLKINNIYCTMSSANKVSTESLNVNIDVENGDFYIKTKGSYTEGDATILGTMLSFQKEPTEYDNLNEKTFSLDPNKSYTVYYSVNTKEGGVYSTSKTFTTGALTWSDEEYQATSTTSARLMTATNCDATEGTGFEWRRYGAPENLKPNAVACPVIDGMLIGSLRNLNSEAYYEFRPYYTSSSGNTYYGEWTALFTGDANVYFEPEVRTYEDVMVATNKATLKGYALAGTDDIISQGFEYWESSVQPGTANSLTASVNSKKVEVSGISMTTTVSDLKYGTTYCYRAFATTASGTIYGETVEFTTEKDLSGIENVIVEEDETVEYYNLQGVKIVNPSSGLYIKRQGNKVTKVIL